MAIAERTPMSRTRAARRPNSSASSAGRPNSFTSVAPGAEKRSVICDVMAALWSAASRSSAPDPGADPAGRDRRTPAAAPAASRVICHDRRTITASVRTRAMTLVTTPDSAEVKARWAPMTSLLSRLTRAPVWVRVKKAIGIAARARTPRRRRSRIRPSPRRDDCSRSSRPTPASTTATTAMSDGEADDGARRPSPSTMASTARPASTGVATPRTAATRGQRRGRRRSCGGAGGRRPDTRRSVSRRMLARGSGRPAWRCAAHPGVEVAHRGPYLVRVIR